MRKQNKTPEESVQLMRLNKYIANAGICSRRKADELIAGGKVKVNGEVEVRMGYKVEENDEVTVEGKRVEFGEKIYILLNKPKDAISTTADERGRRTVIDVITPLLKQKGYKAIRSLYPVGRLDRNTTGVLLITNDGTFAERLSHPRYEVPKVYEAELDKPISAADLNKLRDGVQLEDGFIQPDQAHYSDGSNKKKIGVEIHSGRNRIVRRMFGHLGYEVNRLDRVLFSGLTKKNVPRGKWRFLTEQEVIRLKHFNAGKKNR